MDRSTATHRGLRRPLDGQGLRFIPSSGRVEVANDLAELFRGRLGPDLRGTDELTLM